MLPFVYVVSMICIAFAHMFQVIGPAGETKCDKLEEDLGDDAVKWVKAGAWTCDIQDSYFQSFAMIFGGSWRFLDKRIPTLSIMSIVFAFLVGFVLMNMLIALISNRYTAVEQESQTAFWVHRLLYIDEIRSMYTLMARMNPVAGRKVEDKKVHDEFEDNFNEDALESEDDSCFSSGKDLILPPRMDMNEFNAKKIHDWQSIEQFEYVTEWFWSRDSSTDAPNFTTRISAFLVMAQWSDIIFMSIGFKKIVLGVKYGDNLSMTPIKSFIASIICIVILALLLVKAIIMAPLGIVTGGYFWAKEVKEFVFYGRVYDQTTNSTTDHNGMTLESDMQNKMAQMLKKQQEMENLMYEMMKQNTEMKMQVSNLIREALPTRSQCGD